MTSRAFSIDSTATNSYRPWKFSPPAKMFGVGKPINEILEPSVPPRIGSIIGVIDKFSIAFCATSTALKSFSIISAIL